MTIIRSNRHNVRFFRIWCDNQLSWSAILKSSSTRSRTFPFSCNVAADDWTTNWPALTVPINLSITVLKPFTNWSKSPDNEFVNCTIASFIRSMEAEMLLFYLLHSWQYQWMLGQVVMALSILLFTATHLMWNSWLQTPEQDTKSAVMIGLLQQLHFDAIVGNYFFTRL